MQRERSEMQVIRLVGQAGPKDGALDFTDNTAVVRSQQKACSHSQKSVKPMRAALVSSVASRVGKTAAETFVIGSHLVNILCHSMQGCGSGLHTFIILHLVARYAAL